MSIKLKPHNMETYQNVTNKLNKVKLEQKIEIFEEFMKTGEELVGNTTFEGYPIGQWAIQIRNKLNRMNDGKNDKIGINLTKEQLEKLKSMGILKRQINSTIDEKIDSLVEWRNKYPKIKITPIVTDEELREYAKTDEEFSQIQEEYKKMQRYYDYVKNRKHQGKLNEKQMGKCKEGDIGGVFGYSTKVEELSQKYGIQEKDIDYLLTKFGTLDNFYEMYNAGKIECDMDKTLEERIIRNVVDIDSNSNIGYDNLYRIVYREPKNKKDVIFYSSKGLQKAFDELSEREKYVIESIYGLNGEKTHRTKKDIGRELGVTGQTIHQIQEKALGKLKYQTTVRGNSITFKLEGNKYLKDIEENKYLTDEQKKAIKEIKKDIQLQNGDLSENLGKLKEIQEQIATNNEQKNKETNFEDITPKQLQNTEKSKLIQRLLEQQQTIDAQQEEINGLRKLLESPQR